jgi:hypothetical protein
MDACARAIASLIDPRPEPTPEAHRVGPQSETLVSLLRDEDPVADYGTDSDEGPPLAVVQDEDTVADYGADEADEEPKEPKAAFGIGSRAGPVALYTDQPE